MRLPLPPTPFHVLTPFLKQVRIEGWTTDLIHEVDKRLPKISDWTLVNVLRSKGYSPSPLFMTQSAAIGNHDFLSLGRSHNFPCEPKALQTALENGQVKSTQFLFTYYPELKHSFDGRTLLDFCVCKRYTREDGTYCIEATSWVFNSCFKTSNLSNFLTRR